MPIFFGEVAPYCPISKDQPAGPGGPGGELSRQIPIRTSIPRAYDLPSALAAVNILKSIIDQIVRDTVRNNVYAGRSTGGGSSPDRVIDKTRNDARWVEQKKQRVKKKYKYWGTEAQEDKSWAITERIERMVWYDKAWKTYLIFNYGDKGEGEPIEAAAPPAG